MKIWHVLAIILALDWFVIGFNDAVWIINRPNIKCGYDLACADEVTKHIIFAIPYLVIFCIFSYIILIYSKRIIRLILEWIIKVLNTNIK